MAAAVFVLCAITSALCAVLLSRGFRANRTPILAWTAGCFAALTVNNVLLVIDRLVLPDNDLSTLRAAAGFAGPAILLIGLIFETSRK